MVQKSQKSKEIEKVISVFQDYIGNSPYIEWLWSPKLGYILMQISMEKQDIGECRIVTDAHRLCRILLYEVAENVLQRNSEHTVFEADPSEQAEIETCLRPYIDQLPEYEYLLREMLRK